MDVIQVRERDLEARDLLALATGILRLARGSRTKVLVNDRLDVAIAAGADGVHLPGDSLPPAAVRALAPRGFLIGRSVHSVEEARAVGQDADYLVAGTVLSSASKPTATQLLGFGGLADVVAAAAVPVIAIGGLTAESAAAVKAAGAGGMAGIGLYMSPPNADQPGCRATPLGEIAAAVRASFGIT